MTTHASAVRTGRKVDYPDYLCRRPDGGMEITMTNTARTAFTYAEKNASENIPASRGRAWIEISREALRHNAQYLQSLLPERCALMPVVKANAYGHGAGLIAGELNALGIRSFCVACVSEGIELRRQNIVGEILVLGYTHPDQFPLLDQYGLTQTVVDYAHALALSKYACSASRHGRIIPCELGTIRRSSKEPPAVPARASDSAQTAISARPAAPLPVHIAVDTGMRRLGEPAEHTARIREMFALPGLRAMGMYTHLAAAGGADAASQGFTQTQIDTFYRLAKLPEIVPGNVRLHLQASYGILRYPLPDVDCARPGIALYGLLSNAADTRALAGKLCPVLSLRARVASIHRLAPGESAGYDMAYTATRPTTVATVTIGYADGLPRSLSEGRGTVLLHGQRAPVIGRICMDQLLVDVTAIPQTRPGDIATLIGRDGQESISAADLADTCGTITNELLSCLGPRLERLCRQS